MKSNRKSACRFACVFTLKYKLIGLFLNGITFWWSCQFKICSIPLPVLTLISCLKLTIQEIPSAQGFSGNHRYSSTLAQSLASSSSLRLLIHSLSACHLRNLITWMQLPVSTTWRYDCEGSRCVSTARVKDCCPAPGLFVVIKQFTYHHCIHFWFDIAHGHPSDCNPGPFLRL